MLDKAKVDYSNRDLRNYSFRGEDLTGVVFDGSDIRGCNFEETILVGASFENVRSGTTRWQVFELVVTSLPIIILLFFISLSNSLPDEQKDDEKNNFFVLGTGIIGLIMITIFTTWIIEDTLELHSKQHSISLILSIFGVLLSVFLFILILIKIKAVIMNSTGTSFIKANLTGAKFSNSYIESTNFSDAIVVDVSWTDAGFGKYNKGL